MRLAADTSGDDTAMQVVRARPADLVDACWDNRDGGHVKIDGVQTYDGEGLCNDLYPAFPTTATSPARRWRTTSSSAR